MPFDVYSKAGANAAFATAAQGAKADTAVQPAALTSLVDTTDPRLSDARTPTAHAASHASVGSDPLTLAESQVTGLVADLAAKALNTRQILAGTGLTGGGDLTADRTLTVDFAGAGVTTAGKVVNANDARLSDARTPLAHNHAGSEITSGTVAYARLPVGTTASTVAAGDDSRITGAAQKASNLSDLANVATARTNLGLGTAATTASTAYATAAQGTKADTALQPDTAQTINAQTGTSYTLVASDAGKVVTLSNTGAITLNAPGSVFTAGQRVDVVVINTGMATVVGTSGATANGTPSLVSRARWSAFTILWLSSTSAVVIGDLA